MQSTSSDTVSTHAIKAFFTINPQVWEAFKQSIPKGKRSLVIEGLIRERQLMEKRKKLLEDLPKIRAFPLKRPLRKGDLVRDIRMLRESR